MRRSAIRLLVTAVLLWLLFRAIPLHEVVGVLGRARALWVAVGILLVLVARLVSAIRMWLITHQQDMTLGIHQLLAISCVATCYGVALPSSLAGGAIRWHRISQHDRKPAQSFVAIVYDRLVDTIMLVLCSAGFWLLDVRRNAIPGLGLLFGGALLAAGLAVVPVFSRRIAALWWRWWEAVPWLPALARSKLRKLRGASSRYYAQPASARLVLYGLSAARHLIGALDGYCFVRALGLDLNLISIGWIRGIVMMASMLPLSISGFGVREVSAVVLFGVYDIPAASAVAWSLLSFLKTLVPALIGGGLEAWRVYGPRPRLVRRVAARPLSLPLGQRGR